MSDRLSPSDLLVLQGAVASGSMENVRVAVESIVERERAQVLNEAVEWLANDGLPATAQKMTDALRGRERRRR
jgi:hypothetical protein